MKIIVSGCHGAGKTHLIEKHLLKECSSFSYLKEGIQDWIKEHDIKINENSNLDDQKKLISLKEEQIKNANKKNCFIDRFEGDFWVYARASDLISPEEFKKEISKLWHKYKYVEKKTYFILCQPQKQYLKPDNPIRSLDPYFQKEVGDIFNYFFNELFLDSITLRDRVLKEYYCGGSNRRAIDWVHKMIARDSQDQSRAKKQ